jgi:hypothetical protein
MSRIQLSTIVKDMDSTLIVKCIPLSLVLREAFLNCYKLRLWHSVQNPSQYNHILEMSHPVDHVQHPDKKHSQENIISLMTVCDIIKSGLNADKTILDGDKVSLKESLLDWLKNPNVFFDLKKKYGEFNVVPFSVHESDVIDFPLAEWKDNSKTLLKLQYIYSNTKLCQDFLKFVLKNELSEKSHDLDDHTIKHYITYIDPEYFSAKKSESIILGKEEETSKTKKDVNETPEETGDEYLEKKNDENQYLVKKDEKNQNSEEKKDESSEYNNEMELKHKEDSETPNIQEPYFLIEIDKKSNLYNPEECIETSTLPPHLQCSTKPYLRMITFKKEPRLYCQIKGSKTQSVHIHGDLLQSYIEQSQRIKKQKISKTTKMSESIGHFKKNHASKIPNSSIFPAIFHTSGRYPRMNGNSSDQPPSIFEDDTLIHDPNIYIMKTSSRGSDSMSIDRNYDHVLFRNFQIQGTQLHQNPKLFFSEIKRVLLNSADSFSSLFSSAFLGPTKSETESMEVNSQFRSLNTELDYAIIEFLSIYKEENGKMDVISKAACNLLKLQFRLSQNGKGYIHRSYVPWQNRREITFPKILSLFQQGKFFYNTSNYAGVHDYVSNYLSMICMHSYDLLRPFYYMEDFHFEDEDQDGRKITYLRNLYDWCHSFRNRVEISYSENKLHQYTAYKYLDGMSLNYKKSFSPSEFTKSNPNNYYTNIFEEKVNGIIQVAQKNVLASMLVNKRLMYKNMPVDHELLFQYYKNCQSKKGDFSNGYISLHKTIVLDLHPNALFADGRKTLMSEIKHSNLDIKRKKVLELICYEASCLRLIPKAVYKCMVSQTNLVKTVESRQEIVSTDSDKGVISMYIRLFTNPEMYGENESFWKNLVCPSALEDQYHHGYHHRMMNTVIPIVIHRIKCIIEVYRLQFSKSIGTNDLSEEMQDIYNSISQYKDFAGLVHTLFPSNETYHLKDSFTGNYNAANDKFVFAPFQWVSDHNYENVTIQNRVYSVVDLSNDIYQDYIWHK